MAALRNWLWLVPVSTVVACSFLAARAVAAILAVKLVAMEPPPRRLARRAPPPVAHARVKDADAVIARDIFCSECPAEVVRIDPPGAPNGDGRLPQTTLPLVLVATFAGVGDGAATISNTKTGHAGLYAVGERIPEAGPVRRVAPQTVALWNDTTQRLERLDLVPAPATAPPKPRPVAKAAPAGPDGDLLADADRSVKRVDDRHFQVERGLLDKLLADPMALSRAARVTPAVDAGKAQGFRLSGVRDGSLVTKIGLQNGDVIQSINGFELTSPDKVLEAYARLRSASTLAITVARSGAPVELELAIR